MERFAWQHNHLSNISEHHFNYSVCAQIVIYESLSFKHKPKEARREIRSIGMISTAQESKVKLLLVFTTEYRSEKVGSRQLA